MDKKVLYALIGGATLIGAAVAYHMVSRSTGDGDDEDNLDEDLNQLGPLEIEQDSGMVKFEYFLKILQICSFYGKN